MRYFNNLPKSVRYTVLITIAIVVPCGVGMVAGYLTTQRSKA